MQHKLEPLVRLASRFERLPGIGPKTARRLAYFMIHMPKDEVEGFARDMVASKEAIHECTICGNLTDRQNCYICDDSLRDKGIICVVADAKDVNAIENTSEFSGVYHVLGGTISPIDGIGPDDIRIDKLLSRIGEGNVREIILATNPDIKGEATAAYIARILKDKNVKVTRIAYGIPIGGDVEYTDQVTLSRALSGRREY
ncbi:MAG: recombination mediator RecR [Eubacteriales bacterium]